MSCLILGMSSVTLRFPTHTASVYSDTHLLPPGLHEGLPAQIPECMLKALMQSGTALVQSLAWPLSGFDPGQVFFNFFVP